MDAAVFGLDHRVVAMGGAVLFLIASEVGFRAGRRRAAEVDDRHRSQLAAVQAAVLGLLGLLLAFSFSMAQDRFEARRLAVVEEANAIGTAWLRADALPEPTRTEEKRLLRLYVDARLAFYDAGEDDDRLAAAIAESERLQRASWARAMAETRAAPDSLAAALLVQALNAVIDDHTVRAAALRAHVPESVVVLLILFAAAGVGIVGYSFGLVGRRAFGASVLLSILLGALLFVTLDLDRPRGGTIREDQWSMRALRDAMDAAPP